MFSITLLLLLSCSSNFVQAATPYKDCGSKLGTIQSFDVTGCATAPCKFSKGNTHAMNLTFLAEAGSKTASVSIHGVIAGIPVPFPLPDSDACNLGLKCPVRQDDTNMVSLSLPVLSSYPSISLYVRLEIKADEQNQNYACLQFPATITSTTNHGRDLVGWEQGKLFETIDE